MHLGCARTYASSIKAIESGSAKQIIGFLFLAGCGLEPGPGGLLGALEGVSYLGVCASAGWFLFQRFSPDSKTEGFGLFVEASSYLTILCGILVLALQVILIFIFHFGLSTASFAGDLEAGIP